MSTQLTLIETSDFEADRIVQENQLIDEALHILDRRLFTRGPILTAPDTVAFYLKLHLAQQEHEVVGVIFLDAKHRVHRALVVTEQFGDQEVFFLVAGMSCRPF